MAVHQFARFVNNLHIVHQHAIRCITKYLTSTSTYVDLPNENQWVTKRGVVYRPDIEKGIECYVHSNFSGGWDQADANNAENFMSRTGYVIMHAGCTVLWFSKLQTEIYLSTT